MASKVCYKYFWKHFHLVYIHVCQISGTLENLQWHKTDIGKHRCLRNAGGMVFFEGGIPIIFCQSLINGFMFVASSSSPCSHQEPNKVAGEVVNEQVIVASLVHSLQLCD